MQPRRKESLHGLTGMLAWVVLLCMHASAVAWAISGFLTDSAVVGLLPGGGRLLVAAAAKGLTLVMGLVAAIGILIRMRELGVHRRMRRTFGETERNVVAVVAVALLLGWIGADEHAAPDLARAIGAIALTTLALSFEIAARRTMFFPIRYVGMSFFLMALAMLMGFLRYLSLPATFVGCVVAPVPAIVGVYSIFVQRRPLSHYGSDQRNGGNQSR